MLNALKKNEWDAFVLKYGPRSGRFLQSWSWGEFQKSAGEEVERVAWMSDAKEVNAIAQVIRKSIPHFGTYAYVPRGPIVASAFTPPAKPCLPAGREGAAVRGSEEPSGSRRGEVSIRDVAAHDLFIRAESAFESDHSQPLLVKEGGLRTTSTQPTHTLITNLSISTDELLANMHEKTRYNIRLAEKKGVVIEIGTATIDDVWPVFEATASRDAFRLHGKEYYRKMIACGVAFLAIAKQENDILAANIMIDFGGTRTYLHGASSNVKRNMMAPYLLHWELMKDAQSRKIQFYDWWGVAPIDVSANHAWAGISRFKRGFGGENVSYPDGVDVVLKRFQYTLYTMVRKLRRGFR